MQRTKRVGFAGEQLAADFLERHGYVVIRFNYAVHRVGEIDLIARKDEFLVCIEVKTRYSTAVPFEMLIPKTKQQKIIKTARYYIQENNFFDVVIRFDVIFVDLSEGKQLIAHIISAFDAPR